MKNEKLLKENTYYQNQIKEINFCSNKEDEKSKNLMLEIENLHKIIREKTNNYENLLAENSNNNEQNNLNLKLTEELKNKM